MSMRYYSLFLLIIVSFFVSCASTNPVSDEEMKRRVAQYEAMHQYEITEPVEEKPVEVKYDYFLFYDEDFYLGNTGEFAGNDKLTSIEKFLMHYNIAYKLKSFYSSGAAMGYTMNTSAYITQLRIYVENESDLQAIKNLLLEKQKESNFQQDVDWNEIWKIGKSKHIEEKKDDNLKIIFY